MRQCMDAENLHRRLAKILGQIQAIDRMVDEDVPCEDILSQINAAKSALHKCGQVVLEGHIKHCVRDGIENGDSEKTIEVLRRQWNGSQYEIDKIHKQQTAVKKKTVNFDCFFLILDIPIPLYV